MKKILSLALVAAMLLSTLLLTSCNIEDLLSNFGFEGFETMGSYTTPAETTPEETTTPAQTTKPADTTKPAETTSPEDTAEMVWVSGSGSKYHKTSTCSGMKTPVQVSKAQAEADGKEPCKKCYK